MKQTIRTSRTAGYLEKIFRALNADSFNGEIEEPIITLKKTPTAYGHVTVSETWLRNGEGVKELNISTNYLKRPIEEVVATMIHEMVHLYNMQHNVKDTSRGNSYHNERFRDEAEKHMLHIEKDDKYGWTITKTTDELLEYIIEKGWSEIDMNESMDLFDLFGGIGKGKPTPTKGTNHSRKYQCPKCKCSVRATKKVRIKCFDCDELMIEV